MKKYCYADVLSNFMRIDFESWMRQMRDGINEICNEEAGESQNASWVDCFEVLREELATFAIENPDVHIIFEYVLRYTSHKRPDVLIVSDDKIAILEFKRKDSPLLDDRVQTEEYARNLYLYHSESQNMKVITPMLVLTYTSDIETHKEGITTVVSKGHIAEAIASVMTDLKPLPDKDKWINAT